MTESAIVVDVSILVEEAVEGRDASMREVCRSTITAVLAIVTGFQLTLLSATEDEEPADRREFQPRNNRRRYDDPPQPGSRLRKQLLGVAESGMRKPEEEVQTIAKLATDNYDDTYVRNLFCDLTLAL